MNKEKSCPNCGKEIEVELTVHKDVLGDYCICPHCKSSANKEMYFE